MSALQGTREAAWLQLQVRKGGWSGWGLSEATLCISAMSAIQPMAPHLLKRSQPQPHPHPAPPSVKGTFCSSGPDPGSLQGHAPGLLLPKVSPAKGPFQAAALCCLAGAAPSLGSLPTRFPGECAREGLAPGPALLLVILLPGASFPSTDVGIQ